MQKERALGENAHLAIIHMFGMKISDFTHSNTEIGHLLKMMKKIIDKN